MFVVIYCLFILQVEKEKRLTKRRKKFYTVDRNERLRRNPVKEYHAEQIATTYLLGNKMLLTPPWSDTNIIIPDNKFYFVVEGEIEITTKHGTTRASAGELMLIPAGLKHSYDLTEKSYAKLYWFHFNMQINEKNFFDCYSVPLKIQVGSVPKIKGFFNTVFKSAQGTSPSDKIKTVNAINSLVEYYIRSGNYVHRKIKKTDIDHIIEYVKENYTEKFTLEDLAQRINFTPTYFIKKFKQHTGYSPIYYVNVVKLERAKYLLEQTSRPIGDIMTEVGFYDSAHFSKLFKKHYGFSPSKYRETTQPMKNARIK